MSVTYQDVLEAVCSEVSLVNANDMQHIFSIGNARAAKLAYDVLAAHGFNAHVYDESGAATLYITHPSWDAARMDREMASALHYASIAGNLLKTLPAVDFNIAFANDGIQGKQISIYFPSAEEKVSQLAGAKPAIAVTPPPRIEKPAMKKRLIKKQPDVLAAGPELGKKYPFGIPAASGDANKMTPSKWLSTYVFSNFAESFYAFIGMAFFTLVAISLWIVLKGYLCPDLATKKNRAWYCIERSE